MASPSRSQANGNHHQGPSQDGNAPKSNDTVEETVKAFKAVLEQEDQALREQFGQGSAPCKPRQGRCFGWWLCTTST